MLRRDNNRCRRVCGNHSREDGSVHNKQIVGSVNFGVQVDDRGAVGNTSVVGTNFGGSCRLLCQYWFFGYDVGE